MTIYDFIKKQEVRYQKPIELEDGWWWSMKAHLRRSYLYKHSQFEEENDNRDLRPNKNIVRGILNVHYRTEGFDVKDIDLYVDDKEHYYKSFLVKKFHDDWALDNQIDTFIDDLVQSYVDYGGALVRNVDEKRPIVINLRSLAFCSQKDILANPFAIKHEFSVSQLREMTKWDRVEDLIVLSKKEDEDKDIIVYEVIGTMPSEWLGKGNKKDIQQIQVVAFYKDQNSNEQGITLFKSELPELTFKFLKRDKIDERALGWGGVEELFETQIWTNWNEVKITEMLDSASKTLFKSTDPAFKTRQNLNNVDNNEVLTLQEGRDITQLDTYPRNLQVFQQALERWEVHAMKLGSISEGMMGESPSSGTPFKLFEAQQIQAQGMHKFRQGQIAVFVEEIYRDWSIPSFQKEITKDMTFLSELSANEMQQISEAVITNRYNKAIVDEIIKRPIGENIEPEEATKMLEDQRKGFFGSSKKFLEILKDDFKNKKLDVHANIVGKQKNLALLTDKIVGLVRQFIATPQIRQDPEMVKLLNTILESSGMSPIMFGAIPQQQGMQGGSTEPLKQMSQQPAMAGML